MEKLQVKIEHLPSRCEVCHQSDLFDAEKSFCNRCDSSLEIHKLKLSPLNSENYPLTENPIRGLMPLSYFLGLVGSAMLIFSIITFIGDIIMSQNAVFSRSLWIVCAVFYLYIAWLLLSYTKNYGVFQEILVLFLNLILWVIIMFIGITITIKY